MGQGPGGGDGEQLRIAGRVDKRGSSERCVDHAVQAVLAADDGEAVDDGEGDAFGREEVGDPPVGGRVRAGAPCLGVKKGAGAGDIARVQHDRSSTAGCAGGPPVGGKRECACGRGAAQEPAGEQRRAVRSTLDPPEAPSELRKMPA